MHSDLKVFLNKGHEDGADSAVTRKQTYRTAFQSISGGQVQRFILTANLTRLGIIQEASYERVSKLC